MPHLSFMGRPINIIGPQRIRHEQISFPELLKGLVSVDNEPPRLHSRQQELHKLLPVPWLKSPLPVEDVNTNCVRKF
jgi:hypothetical protein